MVINGFLSAIPGFRSHPPQKIGFYICGSKPFWGSHFGWYVASPPILEPILVVGLGCSLGGYDVDFDPWPYRAVSLGFVGHQTFFLEGPNAKTTPYE